MDRAGKNEPFIKICGITRPEDALFAIESGADAIGFIAYPKSQRYVTPEKVSQITGLLQAGIRKVAVFVNPGLHEINEYLAAGVDIIQLHGDETAEFAEQAAKFAEVWKAIRPKTTGDVLKYVDFPACRFLIDSFHGKEYGGTGIPSDWNLAKFAVDNLKSPVILAGGINPENVLEALKFVHPSGIDLSSGVESSPGIKDHVKIRKLFEEIRRI